MLTDALNYFSLLNNINALKWFYQGNLNLKSTWHVWQTNNGLSIMQASLHVPLSQTHIFTILHRHLLGLIIFFFLWLQTCRCKLRNTWLNCCQNKHMHVKLLKMKNLWFTKRSKHGKRRNYDCFGILLEFSSSEEILNSQGCSRLLC